MADVRVLIVADDALVRAGLGILLSQQAGCNVVGQVSGGAELSSTLEVYRPDVVAWELGFDPVTSLERLSAQPEGTPPVMVLLPDETHAASAWTAGARGFFLRSATPASLVAGLVAVSQGLVVIDPEMAPAVFAGPGTRGCSPRLRRWPGSSLPAN